MINKNVCPNCGQLYDTDLEKCPLCGTAAQVVEADAPVQRKRITEAERRQRRMDRKEAEQEARLRKKNDKIMQDAEEERLLKEAAERRKEEKRLKKEAKRAAKQGREESGSEVPVSQPVISPISRPVDGTNGPRQAGSGTPAPDRMTRRPTIDEQYAVRDNTRVPRFFLAVSFLILLATLVIGGSYLLWKTGKVDLKLYDDLFDKYHQTGNAEADGETQPVLDSEQETDVPYTVDPNAEKQPCQSLKLKEQELVLDHMNATKQIGVETVPNPTTDAKVFVCADESIAKVSAAGVVTAVAPGTVTVTVTCGSQSVECKVICDFEADPDAEPSSVDVDELELNYPDKDMTFFNPGESTTLTIVNIPSGTHVEWKSQDETIATVDENGRVTAVGNGTTKVIGTVGDKTVECWVRCHFPEENP